MSEGKAVRVLVVEDQATILKHQLKLLREDARVEIVGTATNGEEAVDKALKLTPDVLLLDLGLPKKDGIEVTREVKTRAPKIEILIFTIFDEEEKVIDAVRAGASGYLLKGAERDRIVESILEVHSGGTVIQPSLARRLLKHFRTDPNAEDEVTGPVQIPDASGPQKPSAMVPATAAPRPAAPPVRTGPVGGPGEPAAAAPAEGFRALTQREVEILRLIAKGLSNSEAARVLGLSKATIRTHLEHIYAKLDVTNRVEAVTEGIRQGLIEV